MSDKKNVRSLLILLGVLLAAAVFFLLIRFVLPLFLPFLLALLTARLIEPLVRMLIERCKVQRRFASASCVLLVILVIGGSLSLLAIRMIYEISAFVRALPSLFAGVPDLIESGSDRIYQFIVAAPVEVQGYLENALANIGEKIAELPAHLAEKLLAFLTSLLSSVPRFILFAVTYAISLFFISGGYGQVRQFLAAQVPERFREKVRTIKTQIFRAFGKWLRAELTLMAVTFAELCAAFFLMRIEYAAVLAAVVALIDALPVLGVGTVLLPWAALELFLGNTSLAVELIVSYGVITLVRSYLEPKLVGKHLGLHPAATLLATYIGFRTVGIGGMILFPILLILLKQLNDSGSIRLWKKTHRSG